MNLLTRLVILSIGLLLPFIGWAAYPERPIKIIVPYTPGGGPDVLARTLANVISPRVGQAIIIDNKPGANGTIGIEAIAKSPADGYTIGLVLNSFSMNPGLYKNIADPVKAFTPIGLIARGTMVLVTRPSLGAKDLQSFVALSKAKQDGLTYATPGSASPQHLATALLGQQTGVPLMHIPYRGSAPATLATMAGEVDFTFMPVHTALPYIKDGKLTPMMVSTLQRSARLPDVPTAEQLGFKDFDVDLWYAVIAPRGTPAKVVERIRSELELALKEPTVIAAFENQGLVPTFLPAAEFTKLLKTDIVRWGEVIRRAKIKVD